MDAAPSFEHALGIIVARVCLILGTEVCSVYVFDKVTGDLRLIENEGFRRRAIGKVSLAPGEGVVGLVAERGEPLNIENASEHPRYRHFSEIGEEPFSAFLGVPVIHNRRVLGVITVQQTEVRRFREDEEAFLTTLAAQLANVVAHAEATGNLAALLNADYVPSDVRYEGIAGAPGIAIGTAVVIAPSANFDHVPDKGADDVIAELTNFDHAVGRVRADIEETNRSLSRQLPAEERALFSAYLHMLDDTAIAGEVREEIRQGNWRNFQAGTGGRKPGVSAGHSRQCSPVSRHRQPCSIPGQFFLSEKVRDDVQMEYRTGPGKYWYWPWRCIREYIPGITAGVRKSIKIQSNP